MDSNVLISAIVFDGTPRDVLNLAITGGLRMVVCGAILDEVKAVLEGQKFRFPAPIIYAILREIETLARIVDPKNVAPVIEEDPSDDKVLVCALESKTGYLVTEDRHLLDLKKYQGVQIVSPSQFLKEIGKG